MASFRDQPIVPWAAAVLVLALALALPLVSPTYYLQLTTRILLFGTLAMALNLAVGFGGMVSLCHAAFFGLAGYALALLSPGYGGQPILWTLPLAVGAAALAAFAIGALSLRTRGVYFIMVTLAFGEMLFYLFHDTRIAGGSDGIYIYGKPTFTILGAALLDLEKPSTFYYVAVALAILVAAVVSFVVRSPFGRALAASRDNERRARSLGFPVYWIRLVTFTISGALAGLAGYFWAAQYGFLAPQTLAWQFSATALIMIVIGGMGAVGGPLVGALVLMGLEEVLPSLTDHPKLVKGLVVILIVLAFPGGLRDLGRRIAAAGRRRAEPGGALVPATENDHAGPP